MSQTHISEVVAWLGLTTDQSDGLCSKCAGTCRQRGGDRDLEGRGSQPLGTTGIPAGYATRLSVFGPSVPSIKLHKYLLLFTNQGSWHHLTSTA